MRKKQFYIETSTWSHFYADDTPEKRDWTRDFFQKCEAQRELVALYVSKYVLDELDATPGAKRQEFLSLVQKHHPVIIRSTKEVEELAEAYLLHAALPPCARIDALHAAAATIERVQVLVSWNCRHLANIYRKQMINAVNVLMGYFPVEIVTPLEVFEDDSQ